MAIPKKSIGWSAPLLSSIPTDSTGTLIRYGRELIVHTSRYLGPKGSVRNISNGMNCQNCHLDAGTRPFGNNYSRVASSYPKFRARSGSIEGFEKRVNDCIQRSLNGDPLDPASHEMKAIVSYIKWVGKDVKRETIPEGSGFVALEFLDREADPRRGKVAFLRHCVACHGKNGEGKLQTEGREWIYPPLWGHQSYNTGAGFFRITNLAAFLKANMPYGTTHNSPVLSDEESWDIAAYINTMPHPEKDFTADWPDVRLKPVDHPVGPYADGFSAIDHQYGPFIPILKGRQDKTWN
jgi:thiosulfate dehydrogenase